MYVPISSYSYYLIVEKNPFRVTDSMRNLTDMYASSLESPEAIRCINLQKVMACSMQVGIIIG